MKSQKRKIVLDLAVSLDGLIEGPNGEIDWCIMDDDMNFDLFLKRIDTILFGRKSYELFKKMMPKDDFEQFKQYHQIVFSYSSSYIDVDVEVINSDIVEHIHALKAQPGKDIWLYGGASLIKSFMEFNLIDEFRLSIHPIILGLGKPLFIELMHRTSLELVDSHVYSSGVVQLVYHQQN